jgi:hypothetical protein
VVLTRDGHGTRAAGAEAVRTALTRTQDQLAALAAARDPAPFLTVLSGRSGIAGIYGLWQRARALVTGRRYVAEHTRLVTKHPVSVDQG